MLQHRHQQIESEERPPQTPSKGTYVIYMARSRCDRSSSLQSRHRTQLVINTVRRPDPLPRHAGSTPTVKESRTGVSVPVERSVTVPGRFGLIPEGTTAQSEEVKHEAGLGGTLRLLGVGPRLYPLVGGLVKVSVYALGFYAEETQAVERIRGALVGLSICMRVYVVSSRFPPLL